MGVGEKEQFSRHLSSATKGNKSVVLCYSGQNDKKLSIDEGATNNIYEVLVGGTGSFHLANRCKSGS